MRNYSATRHDRFLNFPSNPTHNTNFIHAAVDMTGVGWDVADTRRQLTFVSPKHFVGARHWRPAVGTTIRCVDSNNVLRSYVVATRHDILNDSDQATDLFIGTITTTIPTSDHVGFVPYLNLPGEAGYENQDLMVLGKPARGGIGSIESFIDMSGGGINLTRGFIFRFEAPPPNNLPDDDCHGEIGDSGSPSFVLSNGQAAIVGTHTSIDEAGGDELTYDTFVPHYIDELNAIMASDGYHMTEATPAETTIAITQTPPAGPIRAGYPFTIGIGLENTGANHANNLKLTDTLNDDWQDATPLILSSSSTPASAELDRISVEFAASPQLRRYFRVKIVLTEN